MARLGGQVMRRPLADIESEIAAAQEAERKAKHEARKELREARIEKSKADAHAKVEELKAKLHREQGRRGRVRQYGDDTIRRRLRPAPDGRAPPPAANMARACRPAGAAARTVTP